MPITLSRPAEDRTASADRAYWVRCLTTIARPVLEALSRRRLHAEMPVECQGDNRADREPYSHLEALGRSLSGLAPWLETEAEDESEERLRREFASLARQAIDTATDPASGDSVNFDHGYQPIVDAAFLSHAVLRSPSELGDKLEPRVKANLITALEATRSRKPCYNNWLLFSAMTESALASLGASWDHMRVDYALRQHEAWYKGDGIYGDGADFHADYYNSFVIQPMLCDILAAIGDTYPEWRAMRGPATSRARRYAEIQERSIAPDGSFPPIGRSLAYRFGAFQHLSQMALQRNLGEHVSPAQVRSALTAVIDRTLSAPGNFDSAGWLTIGFCGHQPSVGEIYISTGSLYLCCTAFVALGLPATDPFWTQPAEDWTARRLWAGANARLDHALPRESV